MAEAAGTAPGSARGAPQPPGDSGVWFFIMADMGMFALFFLIFMAGKVAAPELYAQSQALLDTRFGLANTLILMVSGAFMARAVQTARAADIARTRHYLVLTLAAGSLFGVSKAMEYGAKFQSGIAITTNEFFGYYFAFTGIHLLHWLVGFGAIFVTLSRLKQRPLDEPQIIWIESVGIYWHMVDLLWVVLFAMIYLLP